MAKSWLHGYCAARTCGDSAGGRSVCYPQHWPRGGNEAHRRRRGTRWGKSYELLALPVLNLLLSVATYFTAGRQAKNNDDLPPWRASCASATCATVVITGVFLNVINVYFMYSAITGTGFGFGF